jgi:uncharacterized protein with HEPN domain
LPFDDPIECFTDILENIGHIEEFLQGRGPAELHNDQRTVFACQYALLIISEAAKRLGPQAPALCPGIPWRDIRGMGNRLRHAYDNLDSMLIWKVYQDDLPALKVAVKATLERLNNQPQPPPLG